MLFPEKPLSLFLLTVPAVLLGTVLGSRFSSRINQRTYLRLVYILLIGMGLLMFRPT